MSIMNANKFSHLIRESSESNEKFAAAIPKIENSLREYFSDIRKISSFDDAEAIFHELDKIQLVLAKAVSQVQKLL